MTKNNQSVQTELQSKTLSRVTVGLSLTAASLIAAGMIMGFSSDSLKGNAPVKINKQPSSVSQNYDRQQVVPSVNTEIVKKEKVVTSTDSSSGSLRRARTDGAGYETDERVTDIERDYRWDCDASEGNFSPMIITDTSTLDVNGEIHLIIDDPDAIESFDDLPGVYVPDYTSPVPDGEVLDRVRLIVAIGKGENYPEIECLDECIKHENFDGIVRYITHSYSWPSGAVEEMVIDSGLSEVYNNLVDGYSKTINIIERLSDAGLISSGDFSMVGDTIRYNFLAVDRCGWYNCCNEAVGEFILTAEMLEF